MENEPEHAREKKDADHDENQSDRDPRHLQEDPDYDDGDEENEDLVGAHSGMRAV
jgi:hypothetical protein